MSHPKLSTSASVEFIDLCQAQVALLTQGLGAAWCAVYLTEEFAECSPKLVPAFVYPDSKMLRSPETELSALPRRLSAAALPGDRGETLDRGDSPFEAAEEQIAAQQGYQIVLPLLYEDRALGLLVARRKERKWKKQELLQIEQVARTLAIARCLEVERDWYRQQFQQQVQIRRVQQNILDDWLHQFRNPLTALRTFGKLLLKRLFPEDRNHQTAANILRESDRLQDLLQQFDGYLDSLEAALTHIEQDQRYALASSADRSIDAVATPATGSLYLLPGGEVQLEPLAVKDVLEPLIASAEAIASERNLTLETRIPTSLAPVQADARALREVCSNAIDNALKYTPSGGRVAIEAGLEKPKMQGIAVRDTGPGIPPEDQAHLFERHYRGVQARGEIPGTGLGLAIAKELIEQMQGEIEIISPTKNGGANDAEKFNLGNLGGTTLIIWLPVVGRM
ncbi:ATP-binding protein [Oscillatoria sp. FACHB-1406]|uniref:GAF domain-containing sensor histidine kinase n=1 Tax=Oscillatoria sp. FACHB-1406 TaxID=2692846 RepID=UPI001689B9E1|nr:ATP-binding protein [Oscillatoria sp. FACHB-1406]MBD2579078.1 GAF domain-containing protein [Oscillatoria sp. FACHB-1406]